MIGHLEFGFQFILINMVLILSVFLKPKVVSKKKPTLILLRKMGCLVASFKWQLNYNDILQLLYDNTGGAREGGQELEE